MSDYDELIRHFYVGKRRHYHIGATSYPQDLTIALTKCKIVKSAEGILMATEQPPFPLTIWEHTPEYQKGLVTAQHRFSAVSQQLKAKDIVFGASSRDVTFTGNCVPVVWRNPQRPFSGRRRTAEDALARARKWGDTGYFRVEDFQDFLKGEGFIVEEAMHDMGFRRHRKGPERWARRQKGDDQDPYRRKWELLFGHPITEIDKAETNRLVDLMPTSNIQNRLGKTFAISAGRTGLIYIALQVNPFVGHSAETISGFDRQLALRAHIATTQGGFSIEAANVRFPGSAREYDGVYIKAKNAVTTMVEVVWPAATTRESLYPLAQDLRDKVFARV